MSGDSWVRVGVGVGVRVRVGVGARVGVVVVRSSVVVVVVVVVIVVWYGILEVVCDVRSDAILATVTTQFRSLLGEGNGTQPKVTV